MYCTTCWCLTAYLVYLKFCIILYSFTSDVHEHPNVIFLFSSLLFLVQLIAVVIFVNSWLPSGLSMNVSTHTNLHEDINCQVRSLGKAFGKHSSSVLALSPLTSLPGHSRKPSVLKLSYILLASSTHGTARPLPFSSAAGGAQAHLLHPLLAPEVAIYWICSGARKSQYLKLFFSSRFVNMVD